MALIGLRPLMASLVVTASTALPGLLTGALAVQMMPDLGLTDARLGIALGAVYLTTGVSAFFTRHLVRRFGWRISAQLALLATAALVVAMGLAVSVYRDLLVSLVCIGVFHGVSAMAGNVALTKETPDRHLALFFALKQSSIPGASLLAGVALSLFADADWRFAFIGAAVVPLVGLFLVGDSRKDRPAREVMEGMSRGEVRSTLLLMALAGGLANVSVGALNAFFVVSAVESGLEAKVVGTLLAAASIGGITIRLLGGWLLDKTRASPFPAVAALMAIGTVGVALLATGKPSFIVVGVFAAFGGVWGWAGMLQYGIVLISPEAPASASGVVLSGLASGMAIGPVLFGVMAGSLGYSAAWVVAAASAGIAALLMTLVARTGRRHLVLVSGVTTVTG